MLLLCNFLARWLRSVSYLVYKESTGKNDHQHCPHSNQTHTGDSGLDEIAADLLERNIVICAVLVARKKLKSAGWTEMKKEGRSLKLCFFVEHLNLPLNNACDG